MNDARYIQPLCIGSSVCATLSAQALGEYDRVSFCAGAEWFLQRLWGNTSFERCLQ